MQGKRKISVGPCKGRAEELWSVDNFNQFRNQKYEVFCLKKKKDKLVPSSGCKRDELVNQNYSFFYSMFEKTLVLDKDRSTSMVVSFDGESSKGTPVFVRKILFQIITNG